MLKKLPDILQKATIFSLVIASTLFIVEGSVQEERIKQRGFKRFVSLVTMFYEDGIMIPVGLFAALQGAVLPLDLSIPEISELIVIIFGTVLGGTVVVAKTSYILYEALWGEEIYQGDYDEVKEFLRREDGPPPFFLISSFVWKAIFKIRGFQTAQEVSTVYSL